MPRYTDKKAASVCRKIFANSATVTRYDAEGHRIHKPINGWYTEEHYIMTDGYRAIGLKSVPSDGVPCMLSAKLLTDAEKARLNQMRAGVEKLLNAIFTEIPSECFGPLTEDVVNDHTTRTKTQTYFRLTNQTFSPAYNPRYVKDFITLYPDAGYFIDTSKGALSPLWAVSAHGVGVLLPVRVMD